MSEAPPPAPSSPSTATTPALPSPLRCFLGAVVAGAIAYVLYTMTANIAYTFVTKPIHTDNYTAQRIAAAVRTLVVGLAALGTGIFGLASLGLLGLGIQILVRRPKVD